jgi:hypothetical protein
MTSTGGRAVPSLSPASALALGTIVVGILDLADALIFFGLRGVAPIRILQSIASGLLGRAAFSGGWQTAVLGVLLHFFIAFTIVLVFMLASRRIQGLTRRPILSGLLYGLAAYCVMNFIVVPLSAAASGARSWPVLVNGIAIHMLGVGLPASLFARAASVRIR